MPVNKAVEAQRKSEIMEAALGIIAEKGFQNLTLDDVARAAGISKGGLVHYYPNKKALMKNAVVEFYQRIFDRGLTVRDGIEDPLEQVLSYTWLYDWDDMEMAAGYRMFFDFMALASQDEEVRGLFHDWVENWIGLLTESIEAGVSRGRFTVADVEGTARAISCLYQGIASRWYLDRDAHPSSWAMEYLRRTVSLMLTGGTASV